MCYITAIWNFTVDLNLKEKFTQNEKSIINYSPWCHSKPVIHIFRTQIKIFLMKSESFLTCNNATDPFKAYKDSKDIKGGVCIFLKNALENWVGAGKAGLGNAAIRQEVGPV